MTDLETSSDEQVERHAVVADHRLGHRRDRLVDGGEQPVGVDEDLLVVGGELARDEVGVLELVARLARRGVEADAERLEPDLALLREQAHDQRRVEAAGEQHADGDVRDHAALARPAAARRARRRASRSTTSRRTRGAGRARGASRRGRRTCRRAARCGRWPGAACGRPRGSCAAPGRRSGRSCSGAARPGRSTCRPRRPPAAPAGPRRTAAGPGSGCSRAA